MSLPGKAEKEYLNVARAGGGLTIRGRGEHLHELAALYAQRGIPCRWEPSDRDGEAALWFDCGADPTAVSAVLESYKNAKGS